MNEDLSSHPERLKWNDRFQTEARFQRFNLSPLLESAMAAGIPDGPVLELACGMSGHALALAQDGRDVLAVDISDVALSRLAAEAETRRLTRRITCVQADLTAWRPPDGQRYALVLCVMYWDAAVFDYARKAVAQDGIIAWQAFSLDALRYRPWMDPAICLQQNEPASRLPGHFTVLEACDLDDGKRAVRCMIARRIRTS